MVDFVVLGPFDVAIKSNGRGGRILEQATEIKKAIEEQAESSKIAGPSCYVFAYSAPRSGAYPVYVGDRPPSSGPFAMLVHGASFC